MRPNYTTHPLDLSAAAERTITGMTGYLTFLDAVNADGSSQADARLQIALGDAEGDFFPMKLGSEILSSETKKFRVKWDAQPGITATLLTGNRDGLRVNSSPTVTLVDGSVDLNLPNTETAAGQTFIGGDSKGAVAAQYSMLQLFNPAGSGVTCYARAVVATSDAATLLQALYYNTALTSSTSNLANKTSGGSAPACQVRSEANASVAGFVGHAQKRVLADTPVPMLMVAGDVFALGEGEGLIVANLTVNTGLFVTFEWVEKPT